MVTTRSSARNMVQSSKTKVIGAAPSPALDDQENHQYQHKHPEIQESGDDEDNEEDGEEQQVEEDNVIVDIGILEAAKENIQPLASGRRATALASVLAKKPAGVRRDAELAAAKARLWARVEDAQAIVDAIKRRQAESGMREEEESEDGLAEHGEERGLELTLDEAEEQLLDAYVRLVSWTVEYYPRGQSAESGILELLEKATRMLRYSGFARGDARYLNLWMRYAGYVDRPEVIYEFLLANEIGTMWAKLYEEYAGILEKYGRLAKSDEIYRLGVARKAEPLDQLTKRHIEFQKRMMVTSAASSTPNGLDSSGDGVLTPASSPLSGSAPNRKVLGEVATPASSSSTPSASASASSSSSLGFSASASGSTSSSSGTLHRTARSQIGIFADPTGEVAQANERTRAGGNAWPELGTRKERVKENVRAAEKMAGTKLKLHSSMAKQAMKEAAAKAKSRPKIGVYVDPEPGQTSEPHPELDVNSNTNWQSAKFEVGGEYELEPEPEPESVKPVVSKIVPFVDEDVQETTAVGAAATGAAVLGTKAVGGIGLDELTSEAKALKRDPFKNHKDL